MYGDYDMILNSHLLSASHPHGLAILLQFCDERVSLSDKVGVLLVLIVRSVCLDDAIDAVNCARDALGCDELGEITARPNQQDGTREE